MGSVHPEVIIAITTISLKKDSDEVFFDAGKEGEFLSFALAVPVLLTVNSQVHSVIFPLAFYTREQTMFFILSKTKINIEV